MEWTPISAGSMFPQDSRIDSKIVGAITSMTPTFCSFLNVDLMSCILVAVDGNKEKDDYLKRLHLFRQNTSFYIFFRMLPRVFPELPEGFHTVKVILDWSVHDKLEKMESLRQELASLSPLFRVVLLLRKIKLDPLSIEWVIPSSMESACKCLKDKDTDFFKYHGIVRCFIDEVVIESSNKAGMFTMA